ncbi:hypothetical protein VNO77_39180 [Canavalia gladiata]|uniref:Uncharacterized protein n=1 Tax=Canavalia gladiata TaxID=3824 RepID=A0AAN9KC42_CANGL
MLTYPSPALIIPFLAPEGFIITFTNHFPLPSSTWLTALELTITCCLFLALLVQVGEIIITIKKKSYPVMTDHHQDCFKVMAVEFCT